MGNVSEIDERELMQRLMFHWQRAGRTEEALSRVVHYMRVAADAAFENLGLPEACNLLKEALQRTSESPKLKGMEGPLQRRLGHCMLRLGELSDARRVLHEAL